MTRNAANRNRLEWIMLVMVLMTVGALLGYSQYSERREIEDREGDRLQVQARVIGENLERQLEGVNNALAGIRDDLLQFGAKGRPWFRFLAMQPCVICNAVAHASCVLHAMVLHMLLRWCCTT